jgi:site-specific DNA recombinase
VDAYLRDSGGSNQDRSVARQLEALTAYCQQYQLVLRSPYQDAAKSGRTTAGRENFQRMVDTYDHPELRPVALLIWNYARFARDVDDSQLYKALFRKRGIIIHSLTDPVPEGRFSRVIEALIETANQEKAEQTAIDAADGLRSIVQQGAVPGLPPAGFMREPIITLNARTGEHRTHHRWVPDPDKVHLVKRAFDLKAMGATLKQIHNETHLYTSINSYRTFFSNQLYIGILQFGNHTIENYCEPIISLDTWNTVQKIQEHHANLQNVKNSAAHPRRRAPNPSYLLTGLARCARCGSPLYGMTSKQRNGGSYYRYACTGKKLRNNCDLQPIPAHPLEREVIANLKAFFDHPQNIQDLIDEDRAYAEAYSETRNNEIRNKQKELTLVRRSITNITNAISASGHSNAILRKLRDLEFEENDILSKIEKIKNETPELPPIITTEEIYRASRRLVDNLTSNDIAKQRSAILITTAHVKADRTSRTIIATIDLKFRSRASARESASIPEEPDGDEILEQLTTAFLPVAPMGAQRYKRSIEISFTIAPKGKPRSP